MSDYIKREDALNASKLVYIECIEKDDGGFLEVDADNIPIVLKRDIMEIPTADVVERKRGKWRENGEPNSYGKFELWYYDCSLCGAVGIQEYNYCPNCGASMKSMKGE